MNDNVVIEFDGMRLYTEEYVIELQLKIKKLKKKLGKKKTLIDSKSDYVKPKFEL